MNSPDPNVTLSKGIENETRLFQSICAKYGITQEKHKQRANAALMIKQLGTKACSNSVRGFETFEPWLRLCNEQLRLKKSEKKSQRRKRSNVVKQPPLKHKANPNFEVVDAGKSKKFKVSRKWRLKHTKHQLEDEDENILRRTLPKM